MGEHNHDMRARDMKVQRDGRGVRLYDDETIARCLWGDSNYETDDFHKFVNRIKALPEGVILWV